jgi:hypothetical protein
MECTEACEWLIESLAEPLAKERQQALDDHLGACGSCARFAEIQRSLDGRLAAAMPEARLSASFRGSLRRRMRRDPAAAWPDFLPDVAHLAGCAAATALVLLLAPLPAGLVVVSGAAFTAATYFLQTVLRSALDALEGGA